MRAPASSVEGKGSAVMPAGSMDRTSLRVSGLAILRK
jgi:hypothetical protein